MIQLVEYTNNYLDIFIYYSFQNGKLPIHYAAERGSIETIEWILSIHPEQLNSKTKQKGETLLHRSCHLQKKKTVAYLLNKGADVTVLDNVYILFF